ncbi:AhpC/TSA family protein [Candidatus Sulfidibacterium hydrothermale]|uniref:TlpA disulfide reductase family protein n=1 Tax=Candidatus Sulfidibacterium hydrothermale TaxID=2875962 RepID=UPI001F0A9C28|nr:TlpA disulfide reductase family protein [Candidatus Sulfidibacterium hydrothermale]UBM62570.1 AhpC/TSA family protein [Candidatus Sulfidibacterium hydrothermale]
MRKIIQTVGLLSLALLIFASCQNTPKGDQYTITMHIKDLKQNVKVIMQKRKDGKWIKKDSIILKNGQGVFKGHVDQPELYYLTIKKFMAYIPVWVENSNITVDASLRNLRHPVIKGSKAQTAFDAYADSTKKFMEKERVLGMKYSQARIRKDEKTMKDLEDQYNQIEKDRVDYMLGYVKRHNKSVVSPYIIMSNSYGLSLKQLEEAVNSLDAASMKNNEYYQYLKKRVATLKRVAVGQPYVDFTLNNPDGKPISLSSVVKTHKYTLVDFWASWCMPCRAENPNVVKAYNEFKDKGFTVFGVSFDKDHDKWVAAIKKDGLTWPQVSDLKFWSSEAGKLYGVQSIPHNVLIGPDGKIVAENLRGQALVDTLKNLLK